jgi:hypothetical protein
MLGGGSHPKFTLTNDRRTARWRCGDPFPSELDSLWDNYNLDWINSDPGYCDIHRRNLYLWNNDRIDLDDWRGNNHRVDSDFWDMNRHR